MWASIMLKNQRDGERIGKRKKRQTLTTDTMLNIPRGEKRQEDRGRFNKSKKKNAKRYVRMNQCARLVPWHERHYHGCQH